MDCKMIFIYQNIVVLHQLGEGYAWKIDSSEGSTCEQYSRNPIVATSVI